MPLSVAFLHIPSESHSMHYLQQIFFFFLNFNCVEFPSQGIFDNVRNNY